jgi:regulator of replication initiation timing
MTAPTPPDPATFTPEAFERYWEDLMREFGDLRADLLRRTTEAEALRVLNRGLRASLAECRHGEQSPALHPDGYPAEEMGS